MEKRGVPLLFDRVRRAHFCIFSKIRAVSREQVQTVPRRTGDSFTPNCPAGQCEQAQPARAQPAQQIRGNWAPVSLPRMRAPPREVRRTTQPGRLSVIRPMIAAPSPPSVCRSASSAASACAGSTTARRRPSHAL